MISASKASGLTPKTFDYKSLDSFPARYLKTYYQSIDQDELEITRFLVDEYKKIEGNPHMLELGCGPTIHHALPAIPYVSKIDFADYLPENIEAVTKWRQGHKQAHNWNHFTKLVLEFEGSPPSIKDIAERENQLRQKMNKISFCDVLQEKIMEETIRYPIVNFFYCAEEVAVEKNEWKKIMRRVASLVAPGGKLFLAAIRKSRYYTIVKENDHEEKLPTTFLTEKDFESFITREGFIFSESILKVAETPQQAHRGINSIILLSAKKSIQVK